MKKREILSLITTILVGSIFITFSGDITTYAADEESYDFIQSNGDDKIPDPNKEKEKDNMDVLEMTTENIEYNHSKTQVAYGTDLISGKRSFRVYSCYVDSGLLKIKQPIDWRLYESATVYAKHFSDNGENQKNNTFAVYTGDEIQKGEHFKDKFNKENDKSVIGVQKDMRDIKDVKQFKIYPDPLMKLKNLYLQCNLDYEKSFPEHGLTSVNIYKYIFLQKRQFNLETILPQSFGMKITKADNKVQEISTPFAGIYLLDINGNKSNSINYGDNNKANLSVYSDCGEKYAISYSELDNYKGATQFDHFDLISENGNLIGKIDTNGQMNFDITNDFILGNYNNIQGNYDTYYIRPVFKLKPSNVQIDLPKYNDKAIEFDNGQNAFEKVLKYHGITVATIKYNNLNEDNCGTTYGDEFNIVTTIDNDYKDKVNIKYEVRSGKSINELNASDIIDKYAESNDITVKLTDNYYSVKPVFSLKEGVTLNNNMYEGMFETVEDSQNDTDKDESEIDKNNKINSNDNQTENKEVPDTDSEEKMVQTGDDNLVFPLVGMSLTSLAALLVIMKKIK